MIVETKPSETYSVKWSAPVMRVIAAMQKMEKLFTDHAKVGASDSEPVGVYRHVVRLTLRGKLKTIKMPQTSADWSLYDMSGCKRAAAALSKQLAVIVDAMQDVPLKHLNELTTIVDERCN